MLERNDLIFLESKGIPVSLVERQIRWFEQGFSFSDIQRPATIGDGIIALSTSEEEQCATHYDEMTRKGAKPVKFVPASGAATRMFKDLYGFLSADAPKRSCLVSEEPYRTFFGQLHKFPFYQALMEALQGATNPSPAQLVDCLLNPNGLGYGSKPKGALLFHTYHDMVRTAAMEHLHEGMHYANDCNHGVDIHFTVSPEHLSLFESSLQGHVRRMEGFGDTRFNITYSFQKPSTDTIAVDPSNTPIRTETGELVFRPAGHGALIENLNELEQDLVFIKNIDNVMVERLLPTTVHYKKVLAGYALSVQDEVFRLLRNLEQPTDVSINEAARFLSQAQKLELPQHYHTDSIAERANFLHHQLNRPIRVCGMVKNEGEPGGGPFWVKGAEGQVTLQIVEMAQINLSDPAKQGAVQSSTHFNPVDLVCCIKDYKGAKFDLTRFVDHHSIFISEKSMNGRPLRALELPGLWNGAMAGWLTYFIEVPAETFNPVKTVMDLLRPSHQS